MIFLASYSFEKRKRWRKKTHGARANYSTSTNKLPIHRI